MTCMCGIPRSLIKVILRNNQGLYVCDPTGTESLITQVNAPKHIWNCLLKNNKNSASIAHN